MATLKATGTEYEIVQWANDWISVDARDGSGSKVVSPRSLQLEPDEAARLRHDREEYDREPGTHRTGAFWAWWKLSDDEERLVPAMKRTRH